MDSKTKIFAVILFAYSMLERWFGRTKKVEAGSLPDFIADVVSGVIVKVIQKLKGGENK